jgi:hypothetical protein
LRSATIMLTAALGTVAALAAALPAYAEEPFYLGVWKISSAVVAPWADPQQPSDAAEIKALIGKVITIKSKAITGPNVFACKGPHYKMSDFSADMLFQGELGEIHDADKSKDPLALAHALGFSGGSFKTLETGCEFDWHFVDQTTAEIGLNNSVYILKKQ